MSVRNANAADGAVRAYGIAYPYAPGDSSWSIFHETFRQVAADYEAAQPDVVFHPYFGIWKPGTAGDASRLVNDLEQRALRGLLFLNRPVLLKDHAIVNHPGVPRVVPGETAIWQNCNIIAMDPVRWETRALRRLRELGCRRLAVIIHDQGSRHFRQAFEFHLRLILQHGMQFRPEWLQAVNCYTPEWVELVVRKMLAAAGDSDRPDGLLILDDNLVAPTARGILSLGDDRPADPQIIAHANFPRLPAAAVAMEYLGYDLRHFITRALAAIERQAADPAARPHLTRLQPVFASEAGL